MLVRSWNLFNGNTVPLGRRAHLDEMLRLARADDPDILCLQEVPAWALPRFTAGDVAARPRVGPLPVPAGVGRLLTAPNHGLIRSLFAGQGNAIEVGKHLRVLEHRVATLNPCSFRSKASRALRVDALQRIAWAKERRIVQALRLAAADGRTIAVANAHCTSSRDPRIPAAELQRAASFALAVAEPDDVVVLAGDFNVLGAAETLQGLAAKPWGFSAPGPGIDHVLVRGAGTTPLRVWPAGRRELGGRLLSDHAPVELELR